MIEHSTLVLLLGILQFSVLVASSLVPFQLDWKKELASLPKLHYQMYFIYGGYVVLNIIAFSLLCICFSTEIASGSPFARAFCGYIAIFWGIRLVLQAVLDTKPYLKTWWLQAGYHMLTVLFVLFTFGFSYLAISS